MIEDNIVEKLPDQPDGAIEYFKQLGELEHHLLIYRVAYVKNTLTSKSEKMVEIKCTACGETFYLDYISADGCCHNGYSRAPFGFYNVETQEEIINGDSLLCPCCGEETKAIHIGSFSRDSFYVNSFDFVSVHLIEGCLALLRWRFNHYYTKDGNGHFEIKKLEGNIFDKNNRKRVYGAQANFGGSMIFNKDWGMYCNFKDGIGKIDSQYILPFDSKIIEASALPNCKLDKFIGALSSCYPAIYLRLIQSYPNLENLVMNGASYLLEAFIEDAHDTNYYYHPQTFKISQLKINLKGKRPSELLRLNKEEYRYFIGKGVSLKSILFYSAHRSSFKKEDIDTIEKHDSYSLSLYAEISEKLKIPITKLMRYIISQFEKTRATISFYRDYLRMKEYLEEPIDIFPSNLQRAHNNTLERYNEAQDRRRKMAEQERRKKEKAAKEERKEKFKTRYSQLSKFEYQENGLIIIACRDEDELKNEGTVLKHCVYSYKDAHADGKSAIFFIRHIAEPQKPFFTLELDEKSLTVRQNRGKCNCARTEEIVVFEKHWLKFINSLKEKQNGKPNRNKSRSTANT